METDFWQYYQQNGGNSNGVPVMVMGMSLENHAQTINFINQHGLTFPVLEDFSRVAFNAYSQGYIPHNVVINGTANDPNYQQWEILYTNYGFAPMALHMFINSVVGDSLPTSTPTITNTPTYTPTPTNTPTITDTPEATDTPPPTPTSTIVPSLTSTPTSTPTEEPSNTPTPEPTFTPTATYAPRLPKILAAGYDDTRINSESGGIFTMIAYAAMGDFTLVRVSLYQNEIYLGIDLSVLDADRKLYYFPEAEVPSGLYKQRILLELISEDLFGNRSHPWPYLVVE